MTTARDPQHADHAPSAQRALWDGDPLALIRARFLRPLLAWGVAALPAAAALEWIFYLRGGGPQAAWMSASLIAAWPLFGAGWAWARAGRMTRAIRAALGALCLITTSGLLFAPEGLLAPGGWSLLCLAGLALFVETGAAAAGWILAAAAGGALALSLRAQLGAGPPAPAWLGLGLHALPTGLLAAGLMTLRRHLLAVRADAHLAALRATRGWGAARCDPTTGLPDRRAFLQLVRALSGRAAPAHPLSVVIFDLDLLSGINQRFGREVGDVVIYEVAARLRAATRGDDRLAWLGGGSFALVAPDASLEAARRVADRLRAAISGQPLVVGPIALLVTASAGVTTTWDPPDAITPLLDAAREALRRAKAAGRNRTRVAVVE